MPRGAELASSTLDTIGSAAGAVPIFGSIAQGILKIGSSIAGAFGAKNDKRKEAEERLAQEKEVRAQAMTGEAQPDTLGAQDAKQTASGPTQGQVSDEAAPEFQPTQQTTNDPVSQQMSAGLANYIINGKQSYYG
jgi:hypothetical protein